MAAADAFEESFRFLAGLLCDLLRLDVLVWQDSERLLASPPSKRIQDHHMQVSCEEPAGTLIAGRLDRIPFDESAQAKLRQAARLLAGQRRLDTAEVRNQAERAYRRDEAMAEQDLRELTGDSAGMRAVRQAIRQTAPTDATVLILGETGTGKELVARAIHQLSARHNQLLVQVNCGALSPALVTSELFGHEQGAFTGASKQRLGRLELANGGTIFLDEIGEMPPDAQVLLLRALQEGTIERVGANKSVSVDLRVIAATHRDLDTAVAEGAFRADLFYRINVVPIRVPPLCDRREDIPSLARHFMQQSSRKLGRSFAPLSEGTLGLLTSYSWPGNVRELRNIIERAAVLSPGEELVIEPAWFRLPIVTGAEEHSWQDRERTAIREALGRTNGRIYGADGAAALLGLRPTTLYGKMRKLGISRNASG